VCVWACILTATQLCSLAKCLFSLLSYVDRLCSLARCLIHLTLITIILPGRHFVAVSVPSVLLVGPNLGDRKGIWPVKTEWWVAGMVICLEQGADLHVAQLMPLPLTVSCFSKIQKRVIKWVYVCMYSVIQIYVHATFTIAQCHVLSTRPDSEALTHFMYFS